MFLFLLLLLMFEERVREGSGIYPTVTFCSLFILMVPTFISLYYCSDHFIPMLKKKKKKNIFPFLQLESPFQWHLRSSTLSLPGGSVVKNSPAMQETQEMLVRFPASGRSPGGGHGNPLLYSCLENPMDSRAQLVIVCKASKCPS